MSRDRSDRPEQQDDDAFSGALDDLFGPEPQPDEPEVRPETHLPEDQRDPYVPAEPPTAESPTTVPYYPQTGMPGPPPAPARKRTVTQTLGIGCASILIFLFACMVILMVIGLLFGDDTTSASMLPGTAMLPFNG